MSSIAPKNALAALNEPAATVAQAAGAGAPPAIANAAADLDDDEDDIYVPETQLPAAAAAEAATTRDELDVGATTDSTHEAIPGSPPRHAGLIHGLELTPSGGQARVDARTAEVAHANTTRWNSNGGMHAGPGDAEGMEGIENGGVEHGGMAMVARPAPAQLAGTRNSGRGAANVAAGRATAGAAAGGFVPPHRNNAAQQQNFPLTFQTGREVLRDQFVPGSSLINAASASLPSRPLGAPRTAQGLAKRPTNFSEFAAASAAIIAKKQLIRSESLNDYLRREPVYARPGARMPERAGSPSHPSQASGMDFTARPPYPFGQPEHLFTRSPSPGPAANGGGGTPPARAADGAEDRMAVSDNGDPADDAQDDLYDLEERVPRLTGVPAPRTAMTERILNTARRVAVELGHSTVPVDAFGDPTPIDGLARNAHLVGISQDAINFWMTKPGGHVIFELYAINGRRANSYSVDDQIDHMQHLLDCMFLEDFPDESPKLALLFTPPAPGVRNAPRARPSMFMGHGFHLRQEQILRSARFWTVAATHFMTHGVEEPRSQYVTSFGNICCDSLDEAKILVKTTAKDVPPLREFLANKLDAEDPTIVPNVAAFIADNCLEVKTRQVRPSSQSCDIMQYSIYVDVRAILGEDDLDAFDLALRRMVIWHHAHGLANYLTWVCRTCHATSHDEKACEAHVHLKWPMLNDGAGGRGGARAPAHANNGRGGGPHGPRV